MNADKKAAVLAAYTVGVLAGAYSRVKLDAAGNEIFLTHLDNGRGCGEPLFKSCVKPGHLGDMYGTDEEDRKSRPSCPRCAKAWDAARA